MLKKSYRLKDRALFQKAFRFGKPFFFGNIGCKVFFDPTAKKKVGFALAKKILPLAVHRNAIKRLLSQEVVSSWDDIPPHAFVVFFLRKRPEPEGRDSLRSDFSGLISKIKNYKLQ